jgi:ribosomal protein S18 acetylase RimI-like enzyme
VTDDGAVQVREYRSADAAALQRICIATGDLGDPGDRLYRDPALLHLVYLDPYLEFEPELAFVAADQDGPAGYVVGTRDTTGFQDRWAAHWSPRFTTSHPDPPSVRTPDDRLLHRLHHPHGPAPTAITERYPAHLHIDLLPHARRQGIGGRLLALLFAALTQRDAGGVHLGVDERNIGARAFYGALGFQSTSHPTWLIRKLP